MKIRTTDKKDPLFKRLVNSNRFIFLCSLLLAFIMWCMVSVYASPEIERTITNVPVVIDSSNTLEQLGLQIFGDAEYYVDVVVRGPKYQISENMFDVNDLTVTANTSYVDSAGETQLTLKPEIIGTVSDVEIVSLSRDTISVFFDTLKETIFTIEPDVRFPDGVSPVGDGYILDTPILSVSTVTVSGPSSEVNKIKRVVARVENDSSLSATKTSPAQIFMYDENNTSPSYCTASVDELTVTMPVKKTVTLPVSVNFANAPIGYLNSPLPHSIEPASVSAALNADIADSAKTIEIGTIDFSEIYNENNVFTFNTADVDDVKFLDNTLKEITVSVDASSMRSRDFSVNLSSVTSVNLPSGFEVTYDISKPFDVRVVGPETSLEDLTASGIYAEVDFNGAEITAGEQVLDVRFCVKSLPDCWCVGKYKIKATISGSPVETAAESSAASRSTKK